MDKELEKNNLVIRGCDILILDKNGFKIDVNQEIHISGNKIQTIKSAEETGVPNAGRPNHILDGRGMLAIPGLINTHAHVPMVLFRGLVEDMTIESWFNDYVFPLESNLTPEDVYWGALLGIAEMIENGITYVADHYFFMDEVARAVEESGMRANLAWAIFGHEGEVKLDKTSDFVTRWQGKADGRITTWLGPHAPYTTGLEFLNLCARRAKDLNVGIHIHVSETSDQVELSLKRFGITPVKMLADSGVLDVPAILAHCAFPTKDDLMILSGRPCGIAHSPKTYLKLGSGVVDLSLFREKDIPVGLATDGAVSSNTLDILEQMRIAALMQKYLLSDSTIFPVAEALRITFQGGARLVNKENALGVIAPGRLADIVLLRQDGLHNFPRYNPTANLVYSSRTSDVDTVICNGKILKQGGKLLTIDKGRVRQQVSERIERLSSRVPSKRIATYPV